VLQDQWFKKGYESPVFDDKYYPYFHDVYDAFGDSEEKHVKEAMEEQPTLMNAFELISLNKGLNLDNFFESDKVRIFSDCSSMVNEPVGSGIKYARIINIFHKLLQKLCNYCSGLTFLFKHDRSTRERQDLHRSALRKKSSIGSKKLLTY
jgi:hypothetical protein